jgi:beta-1,4-mannosyltransferase
MNKKKSLANSPQHHQLRVLQMPDYRSNNLYQTLLEQSLVAQGVKVKFWNYHFDNFPLWRAVLKSTESFDVLHLHWINKYLTSHDKGTYWREGVQLVLDTLFVRLSGVGVVWTIHNYLAHESPFPEIELWVRRRLAGLAQRIILHHESSVELISQAYQFDRQKAAVIPNGHYRQAYGNPVEATVAREQLNLPLTGRIYLNFGLLRPYKGVEKLIRVWQQNQSKFAQDTLLIVGKAFDSDYETKIKTLAQGGGGIIVYPEFVEDSQLNLFFSAADVIVLPFETILNSSSLILGMSYGKPIIAPRIGGIPETMAIADTLLYDPDDEHGLLQALDKSTQIDLRELSQRVVTACDTLNWDTIAQKTLAVYQSIRSPQYPQ